MGTFGDETSTLDRRLAMTSGSIVQGKLQAWARRKGISLQGSAGERGAPNYTKSVEENLFARTLLPAVRQSFEQGAGGELRGAIPTMSALHSSAALAVNLFQYWLSREDIITLATVLEVPSRHISSAAFEDCFPVCVDASARGFKTDPHLDFAIRYDDGSRVGIECKLFEPYGRLDEKPLKAVYLDLGDAWDDIPGCRRVAQQLLDAGADFRRLGASQLVKHILGLKLGIATSKWRLLYLYLDAPGDEAAEHRAEIKRFRESIATDGIQFVALTVQEFILRAVSRLRSSHTEYVDYLAERYL